MKKRILFVDDEPHILDALRKVLHEKRSEWSMCFAASVEEAFVHLEKAPCDAIVTDVLMPGTDGFAFLERLRLGTTTHDVPVVILTGNDDRDLKHRALEAGATDLLRKPVDHDELVARIHNMLRLKEYQDQIKAHNLELEARVRERTVELERSRIELVWRLGKAGEFRDHETGNHVLRVGYYAHYLAGALGLGKTFAQRIFLTSPLHDIGKIGIPDSVLLKPARLDEEEWEVMKRHTLIGAEILQGRTTFPALPGFCDAEGAHDAAPFAESRLAAMGASIARSHHERWDGTGYPDGLAGEEIPLVARIVSLVDVYDALASKRPYKRAFDDAEVLSILRRGCETQFDPEVFATFERSRSALLDIGRQLHDEGTAETQADVLFSLKGLGAA